MRSLRGMGDLYQHGLEASILIVMFSPLPIVQSAYVNGK